MEEKIKWIENHLKDTNFIPLFFVQMENIKEEHVREYCKRHNKELSFARGVFIFTDKENN